MSSEIVYYDGTQVPFNYAKGNHDHLKTYYLIRSRPSIQSYTADLSRTEAFFSRSGQKKGKGAQNIDAQEASREQGKGSKWWVART